MDAHNNLANQEVSHTARAADPDGVCTVAIITKCDALQQGGEQGVSESDLRIGIYHDTLATYYEVARQRFVDNAIIQAGERYIVGDSGPLKIFSPE